MFVFSYALAIQANSLYIPYVMRALLGLHDQRTIYVSDMAREKAPLQNQLLLTAVPLAKRRDIWNLRVWFYQRSDILPQLTSLLSSLDVDILDCAISTRNQNRELEVDINLDVSQYASQFDQDSATRAKFPRIWPQELYARIVCQFIEDIVFRPDGKPFIYLRRNTVLSNSVDNATYSESRPIRRGSIQLPSKILENIRKQYQEYYSHIPRSKTINGQPRVLLAADSMSRYLLCHIFFANTGHLHVRVNCVNKVGVIARLATRFSEQGLEIIDLYSRDLYSGDRTLADFFIYLSHERDKFKEDIRLRSWVRALLEADILSDLDCRIIFPRVLSTRDIKKDNGKVK